MLFSTQSLSLPPFLVRFGLGKYLKSRKVGELARPPISPRLPTKQNWILELLPPDKAGASSQASL